MAIKAGFISMILETSHPGKCWRTGMFPALAISTWPDTFAISWTVSAPDDNLRRTRRFPIALTQSPIAPTSAYGLVENCDGIPKPNDSFMTNMPIACLPEQCEFPGERENKNSDYGRNMKWNPQTERFVNDPEADKMISRPMRRPWHL